MKQRQPTVNHSTRRSSPAQLSARMTFLGIISWLSVCLILVGLFPEISTTLGEMWVLAGLFGLAAAVGLGEAAKAELRAQNELLSNYLSEARTDALTGLGNRRAFDGDCQQWEADWRRGRTFSLLLIDVDRFKSFNDRYGHQAGDEMLRAVAQVLQRQTWDGGLAFRYGGEEFAVILPDADFSEAFSWAEAVRERITAQRIPFRSSSLSVTVSIGIAVTGPDDLPESLMVRADEHLYLAKAAGRNCTRPFDFTTSQRDALLIAALPAPDFAKQVC